MREYRFRAWHKGYPPGKGKNCPAISAKMLYEDAEGECLIWKRQGQPLIVMQDTGEHDRNNVPIYAGDIIAVPIRKRGNMVNFVVEFLDGRFQAINPMDSMDAFEVADIKDCGIIGNIYETPELLKR